MNQVQIDVDKCSSLCIETFIMISKSTKNFDNANILNDTLDKVAQNGLFYTFSFVMNAV